MLQSWLIWQLPKNRWRWHSINSRQVDTSDVCRKNMSAVGDTTLIIKGGSQRRRRLFFFLSAHCRLFHWTSIFNSRFQLHTTVWSRMAQPDISVPLFNLNDTYLYNTLSHECSKQSCKPPGLFFGAPPSSVSFLYFFLLSSPKFVSLSKMIWRRVALSSLMTSKHVLLLSAGEEENTQRPRPPQHIYFPRGPLTNRWLLTFLRMYNNESICVTALVCQYTQQIHQLERSWHAELSRN